jgi:argininosuccinate lyase
MSLLRGRRLARMDEEAANFTASVINDTPLLQPVININRAHIVSLAKTGVIRNSLAAVILQALDAASEGIALDTSVEDVHMSVESFISKSIGEPGGYLNLGKSRNDQVSAALRIVARQEIIRVLSAIIESVRSILSVASRNLTVEMPGYTHLQVAQPTTVAHYLCCYAECLLRDAERFKDVYKRTNLSPMGSAAFAGTTVPVDRNSVAELLGFEGLIENSMDAVSSRDFLLEFLSAAVITQLDLSRMAEDQIFFSSTGASYMKLPDEYSSTSSIMPQKKNAVVSEIVRAKAGVLVGMFTGSASILKGLNQSYNLDLQEMNSFLWRSSETLVSSLSLMSKLIRQVSFDRAALRKAANLGFGIAADLAEIISTRCGIPFRRAHHIVGATAARLRRDFSYATVRRSLIAEARAQRLELDESMLPEEYDAQHSITSKKSIGSPKPAHVRLSITHLNGEVRQLIEWTKKRESTLMRCAELLSSESGRIAKEVRSGAN